MKNKIPIRVYLAYLAVITLLFSGVTVSKYVASTTSSDQARTAKSGKVSIVEHADFNKEGNLVLQPGVNLKKEALVSFKKSETANFLYVEVKLGNEWTTTDNQKFVALNNKASFTINPEWKYLTTDASTHTFVYYKTIPANEDVVDQPIINKNEIQVLKTLKNSELKAIDAKDVQITFRAIAAQYSSEAKALSTWKSAR